MVGEDSRSPGWEALCSRQGGSRRGWYLGLEWHPEVSPRLWEKVQSMALAL